MLRLLTLLLSCVAVCAQPVLSLNDPTVVAKSSSLLQGLVGYWQLEESSGTRYDRSPNGNHLTSNNSVGQGNGKVGNCATFAASSSQDLVKSSPSGMSFGSSDFTTSAWCKLNSLPTGGNAMFLSSRWYAGPSSIFNWTMYVGDFSGSAYGGLTVRDSAQTSYPTVSATTFGALQTNTWYFVVATFTYGVGLKVSVNNSAQNSTAFTGQLNNNQSAQYSIGSQIFGGYFDGNIDEVGVWNRVLSASEITTLYRSGLGVTYPRFSMRDNRADDFNWDTWEPIYDKPKPFPTLIAFVNRREPEPLLTLCE